uniref:BURP domain-containing protein n=1 Tax=Leersia perrieri TaxID=77586 RepID=A0A0D9X9B6_9ORYZ
MARRFVVALVLAAAVVGIGDAAPSTAEVFWRAVLPDSPLPDAILRLIHTDTNFVGNKVESTGGATRISKFPYNYSDYKASSSSPTTTTASGLDSKDKVEEAGGAAQTNYPYNYGDYKASSSSPTATTAASGLDYDDYTGGDSTKRVPETAIAKERDFDYDEYVSKLRGGDDYNYKKPAPSSTSNDDPFEYDYKAAAMAKPTVFFHEESIRVGETLTFYFPAATASRLGLLPRRAADAIPFTTASLPAVLALLGVTPGSAEAAGMAATLRTCEWPALAGERKFCAASLESMVEGAMAALGTRDVAALTSTLPRRGAPPQAYAVRAVSRVDHGAAGAGEFVACHDQEYPYTVYRCHTTGPARAYMVEMEGSLRRGGDGGHGDGGEVVTVATVCHTDTSRWNPEHMSFKLLGTKPGGVPVCHLMPYGHIIWAKNVKSSTA